MKRQLLAMALLLAAGDGAAAAGADDEHSPEQAEVALLPAAADLKFRFAGKKVTGAKVAERLSPALRTLLNEWAEIADELDLAAVVGAQSQHLILGTVKEKHLRRIDELMAAAVDLVTPLVPRDDRRQPQPVLAFIFDSKGFHSESWEGVVAALTTKGLLVEESAGHLVLHPSGLIMRSVPLFIQPTQDMAGDATQGDDEFRLENEVASKTVQCLLAQRIGPMPPNIQWGFGFYAEQRMFGTSYMFNVTGFVAASDHFDWPKRARRQLDKLQRDETLLDIVVDERAPGTADRPQLLTWALIEHLAHTDPEALRALLSELAALHRRKDAWGLSQSYQGSKRGTREAWDATLSGLDLKQLEQSLKTARSRRS